MDGAEVREIIEAKNQALEGWYASGEKRGDAPVSELPASAATDVA